MASPLLGGPTAMKETTATVLALFTFFAAVYLLAVSDTPGIGWRPNEPGHAATRQ